MSSQEATVICADNSEWMRNGDYVPNRLEAEKDAIRLVANVKTQQNVESTVGLVTMAGRSPEVLVTLTPDIGKILSAVHSIQLGDRCDILAALRIAQLALKHRQNKDQRQRIVLFVGSPIECDKKKLTQLGAWLKKNNVAVDIVSFGELLENTSLLDEFWKAVNNNDNSRLVVIPHGPHVLSDALSASPILDGAEALGLVGVGADGFDTDADESVRMAIEMSILDEQQRLARAAQASGTGGAPAPSSAPTPTPTPTANTDAQATESTSLVTAAGSEMDVEDDEAAILAAAMELSRQTPAAGKLDVADTAAMLEDDGGDDDELAATYDNLSEEEQMRLALQLSMQTASDEAAQASTPAAATSTPAPATTEPATPAPSASSTATAGTAVDTTPAATTAVATPSAPARKDEKPDYSAELNNPEYLNSLFQDLPGVDFSSSSIQNILSAINTGGTGGTSTDKPKDEKSGDKKKDDDDKPK